MGGWGMSADTSELLYSLRGIEACYEGNGKGGQCVLHLSLIHI